MRLKTALVVVLALTTSLGSASTAAAPAPSAPRFVVDGGVALSGRSSVNAGRVELQPLLALRGGALFPLPGGSGLLLGVDARLLLETLPRVRGTADVGSLSWELGLEPRGLIAWRLGDGPLALVPYAFAGALAGGRFADVYAFREHQARAHPTYGVSAGAGGLLRMGLVTLSWELGGGLREDGPALTSTLLVGAMF